MTKRTQAARGTLIVACALVGGVVLGGIGSIIAQAGTGEGLALPAENAYTGDGKFPVNASGQTYGASIDASSPETEPDLILATGVDEAGVFVDGYVLKTDLNREMKSGEIVSIPVYLDDGKTVVGTFQLGGTSNEK